MEEVTGWRWDGVGTNEDSRRHHGVCPPTSLPECVLGPLPGPGSKGEELEPRA